MFNVHDGIGFPLLSVLINKGKQHKLARLGSSEPAITKFPELSSIIFEYLTGYTVWPLLFIQSVSPTLLIFKIYEPSSSRTPTKT